MKRTMLCRLFAILCSCLIFLYPLDSSWGAMDYAKQVLIGSDFSHRDLRGVTFNLANLLKADLSGSDLQGASLFGAKLQEANMSDTNLTDATLDSAILEGTNLTNAVLEDAFAFNARFKDVIIDGADFTNVPLRADEISSLCASAKGVNPITGRNTKDTLGCN